MLTGGIKQADFAKKSGFNNSFISLLMDRKLNIATSISMTLEEVLNIKAETLIRLQKNYELQKSLCSPQKES